MGSERLDKGYHIRPAHPCADYDRGDDQRCNASRHKAMRLSARTLPFVEDPTPNSAEDNDARHMQCPRGEFVLAHLCFTHGVKEELKVPGGPRQRGEEVIAEHWDFEIRRRDRSPRSASLIVARGPQGGVFRPNF